MTLSAAQVADLARAQRGITEGSKAAARVLHTIDRAVPRTAAQLAGLLALHGVQLSDNTVRKLRYVARLLHALDPERLDPDALRHITDLEVMYRVMRVAELTGTPPAAVLAGLEAAAPKDARAHLQAMIAARSVTATPESAEAWRQPKLPRVPLSVAGAFTHAFGLFTRHRGLTPTQAVAALTALLRDPFDAQVAAWADGVGLERDEAPGALVGVMRGLSAPHWHTLMRLCPPPPTNTASMPGTPPVSTRRDT